MKWEIQAPCQNFSTPLRTWFSCHLLAPWHLSLYLLIQMLPHRDSQIYSTSYQLLLKESMNANFSQESKFNFISDGFYNNNANPFKLNSSHENPFLKCLLATLSSCLGIFSLSFPFLHLFSCLLGRKKTQSFLHLLDLSQKAKKRFSPSSFAE